MRLANGPETKDLRDRKPPWELSKVAIARLGGTSGRLPDVIRCRIKSIGYEFPQIAAGSALPRDAKLPVRMLLRLELVGAHAGFSALFHPCEDISEWLVPTARVFAAQRENWRPGDRCYVRFSDAGYHCGNVTHIQTTAQGLPAWEGVTITWPQDGSSSFVSAWDLEHDAQSAKSNVLRAQALPHLGRTHARAALEVLDGHLEDAAANPATSLAGPFTQPVSSSDCDVRTQRV